MSRSCTAYVLRASVARPPSQAGELPADPACRRGRVWRLCCARVRKCGSDAAAHALQQPGSLTAGAHGCHASGAHTAQDQACQPAGAAACMRTRARGAAHQLTGPCMSDAGSSGRGSNQASPAARAPPCPAPPAAPPGWTALGSATGSTYCTLARLRGRPQGVRPARPSNTVRTCSVLVMECRCASDARTSGRPRWATLGYSEEPHPKQGCTWATPSACRSALTRSARRAQLLCVIRRHDHGH